MGANKQCQGKIDFIIFDKLDNCPRRNKYTSFYSVFGRLYCSDSIVTCMQRLLVTVKKDYSNHCQFGVCHTFKQTILTENRRE